MKKQLKLTGENKYNMETSKNFKEKIQSLNSLSRGFLQDEPIIINKIKQYFVRKCKLSKLKSVNPYIDEFTVFINVKIDNLKEFSKILQKLIYKNCSFFYFLVM